MKKFIKKILILTVCAAMLVTAMPLTGIDFGDIFAIEAEASPFFGTVGDFKYSVYSKKVTIKKYVGNDTEVVIPSYIEDMPVTEIGSGCFRGSTAEDATAEELVCSKIKSVVIPETVKSIYSRAFENCVSLEKITFSENIYGLETIGGSAFEGCEKLAEINLPESLMFFDGSALNGTAVEELVLPRYVDTVSYNEFAKTNVKRIIINDLSCIINLNSANDVTEEIIVNGFVFETSAVEENEGITNNAFKRIVCNGGIEPSAQTKLEAYGLYAHYEDDGSIIFTRTPDNIYEETISNGEYEYAVTDTNEAVIIRYIGSNSEIIIPEAIDGFAVTEIADYALAAKNSDFQGCAGSMIKENQITSVTIPSTVKKIGIFAFAFNLRLQALNLPEGITEIPYAAVCNSIFLTNISLPASVTVIGPSAFFKCTALNKIDMINVTKIGALAFAHSDFTTLDLPQKLNKIDTFAFWNSDKLESVDIPDSVTELGIGVFYECWSLENVTLSNNLKKIPYECFSFCKIRNLVIPDSVVEVEDEAFDYCILESLVLSSNLKRIGAYAFSDTFDDYGANNNTLVIPESVEYIGIDAFNSSGFDKIVIQGTNLIIDEVAFRESEFTKLEIKNGVKNIGFRAFYENLNLVELTIENGVERIDNEAFSWCQNLQKIEIPESVKYLGEKAFNPCKNLGKIVFNAVDYTCSAQDFASAPFDGRNVTELVIGDGIKKIHKYTFCYFENITELTIPDSVTEIDNFAFYTCTNLKKLTLSKNLERIGSSSFDNCVSLQTLDLPESIRSIGYSAFGDGAFTSLTFPKGLQTLSAQAFVACIGVTEINFYPESCKFTDLTKSDIAGLYYSPFHGFPNLKTINIGENIKELPAYLFCGIETIDEIVLPSTVTDVGVGAFAFSSITSFKASDNLESIEESAFYGCKNLESADIGNNIMLIGAGAFTGCDKLTEIYIPDTVTNIEMEAFKNCSALQTVHMSPNVDYIPREAFYNCTELSSFTWNAESKLVGRLAFGNCVKLTDFDFVNVEKLYVNSFLGSGVNVVQLGETENEASRTPLTTVEVQSFMDCDNLATLGIGGNVTTIKTQAFANCENLETAVIADSVTEIADDAFDGCDKLTIYCSENSYAHSYAQTQGIRVSTFVIAPIPNQTYTGFEIKPEVSVSASGDSLDKNIDFSVSYANNINVGDADVTVKGMGDFRMFASRATFTIVTKNISAATVAPIADQPYTGSAVTPEITVTDGIKVLREGTDYTVTYTNNVNEGTATAKITGIGNWSGTASADFQISKEAEELGFFAKIISSISSFFARVISFLASIFM